MSDEFAAAAQAISADRDDDVQMEAAAQVISADDDDDEVEIEPHYVNDKGRKEVDARRSSCMRRSYCRWQP